MSILDHMDPPQERKRCYGCRRMKPLSEFHRHRITTDGWSNNCKSCKRAYDKARYAQQIKTSWNPKRGGAGRRSKRTVNYAERSTLCQCRGVMEGFTRDGVTWEYCTTCGVERPVRVRGLRNRFKQFATLENTIAEDVASACKPVNPKYQHPRTAKQIENSVKFKVMRSSAA